MRERNKFGLPWRVLTVTGVTWCLLGGAMLMVFLYAPTETTMGEVQRILYLHVATAWCGLLGCLGMGTCGVIYLWKRRLVWDLWSQAAAEMGWLGLTLTLITGSLWAHQAWGVWWLWEPRLTSSLILWLIFLGIFLMRAGIEEPERRARASALLAILAVADIPMVLMVTRLFRGVHPVAPTMDPRMHVTLLATGVSFTALFTLLTYLRRKQLGLAERVAALEAQCPGQEYS